VLHTCAQLQKNSGTFLFCAILMELLLKISLTKC